MREFGGLQAYPSRLKDTDHVTITTGSVGLGPGATIFGALAQQYVEHHFQRSPHGRYIALVGDAEIDEGSVPEALGEARVYELDNLWWLIDLNRQSLDYIAPEGHAIEIRKLFEAKGWHVILLKYGSKQEAFFKKPHGDKLRDWIDECPNVEYQSLCRADGGHIREVIINWRGKPDDNLAALLGEISDDEVKELALNLGGHDLPRILEAFATAERVKGQPVAILAYTIKGWGLPIAGHFENHAAQLTHEQIEALRHSLDIAPGQEWASFAPDSPEGQWIASFRDASGEAPQSRPAVPPPVPTIQVPPRPGDRLPAAHVHARSPGAYPGLLIPHPGRGPTDADHLTRRGGLDESGGLDLEDGRLRAGGSPQLFRPAQYSVTGALAAVHHWQPHRAGDRRE